MLFNRFSFLLPIKYELACKMYFNHKKDCDSMIKYCCIDTIFRHLEIKLLSQNVFDMITTLVLIIQELLSIATLENITGPEHEK